MNRPLLARLLCPWLLLAAPLAAQEAPEAEFRLIGDVQQKITWSAGAWDGAAASVWAYTAELDPRFTYGPAAFTADSTWTLPLTADLAGGTPRVVFSEAYFRITPAEGLDLTFGQKRFNLGVGQTVTVGDSINPAVGFFDQKTGFRGVTAEWSPVSWGSLSGAVSTESGEADALTGAGQGSVLVGQLQATASLVARPSVTFNPALGLSYDWFGVILTAEGAAEFLPPDRRTEDWSDPALSGSAGARWTVGLGALGLDDVDLTLSGEYLHGGQDTGIRENAFLRVSLTSATAFTATAFAALDLGDQSVLGQATLSWSPWDNLELTADLKAAEGDEGSVYATLGTAAGNARYQASFATTYHF